MKDKSIFKNFIMPILFFIILSFFANYLFLFKDAELITDIKDSELWLRNIKNRKFSYSNGSLYLDNLDRSREYKLEVKLKTYRDIVFKGLELDGKPINFQISSKRIIHSNKIIANIYLISTNFGISQVDETVLTFVLSVPDGSSKIQILNNTKLVSAKLSLSDTNKEVIRFLYSWIFSIIIGFLIFLLLRSRVPKKIIALLTGIDGLLVSVFLLNVFDFRYIYVLAARRFWFFIFIFMMIACLIFSGYILFISKRSREKKLTEKKTKYHLIRGAAAKLSTFIKHRNGTDLYLIIALGLLQLIISAYTFTNDFYIDDYLWLRDYKAAEISSTFIGPVDTTGSLPKYYRPLPLLFLQGQYKVFGETYVMYYLLRYLHLYLNCLLVYFIVKTITGNSFSSFISSLWVATSIYSFSASAWLSSLFDVMMISFALVSVLILISYKTRRGLFWAFFLMVASLMTKESSVALLFVLLLAGLLFCIEKIKKMIGFYFAILAATGAYIFLRIWFWGGLGGMEDMHDYYSISNIPSLLTRLGEIIGLIFVSPGISPYAFEYVAGWIINILLVIFLLFLVLFYIIKNKHFTLSLDLRLIIFGFLWIIFFSLPILFPFTLIRLGYILIPGAAFVIGGAISLIIKNLQKKGIIYILLLFLALVLSQQTVSHLKIGYEKYGKGASFRNAKNKSLYRAWRNNLPVEVRERWGEKIREYK